MSSGSLGFISPIGIDDNRREDPPIDGKINSKSGPVTDVDTRESKAWKSGAEPRRRRSSMAALRSMPSVALSSVAVVNPNTETENTQDILPPHPPPLGIPNLKYSQSMPASFNQNRAGIRNRASDRMRARYLYSLGIAGVGGQGRVSLRNSVSDNQDPNILIGKQNFDGIGKKEVPGLTRAINPSYFGKGHNTDRPFSLKSKPLNVSSNVDKLNNDAGARVLDSAPKFAHKPNNSRSKLLSRLHGKQTGKSDDETLLKSQPITIPTGSALMWDLPSSMRRRTSTTVTYRSGNSAASESDTRERVAGGSGLGSSSGIGERFQKRRSKRSVYDRNNKSISQDSESLYEDEYYDKDDSFAEDLELLAALKTEAGSSRTTRNEIETLSQTRSLNSRTQGRYTERFEKSRDTLQLASNAHAIARGFNTSSTSSTWMMRNAASLDEVSRLSGSKSFPCEEDSSQKNDMASRLEELRFVPPHELIQMKQSKFVVGARGHFRRKSGGMEFS